MPNRIVSSPGLQPGSAKELGLPPLPPGMTPLEPAETSPKPPAGETLNDSVDLKVLTQDKYIHMPWKNGLGETRQIAIHPPSRNIETDEFIWRLSLSEVHDSCFFSVFPGYDVALLLLSDTPGPNRSLSRRSSYAPPAVLHHNDQEKAIPLKHLTPYSYSGEWATTCKIKSGPIQYLTFIANRERAQVSMNIETICPHGLASDDGHCSSGDTKSGEGYSSEKDAEKGEATLKKAAPTSKMLLGHFTIVYVISGGIEVEVNEHGETHTVLQGQTLICERADETSPTDFAMTPIHPDGSPLRLTPGCEDHVDATILIIQLNLLSPNRRASVAGGETVPLRPRGRAGSIIVYDDQPASMVDLYEPPSPTTAMPMDSLGKSGISGIPVKQWDSARHYRPPVFSTRYQYENQVPPAVVKDNLDIAEFPPGKISTAWINMVKQGLSEWIRVPVIVARGAEEGPVLGITAVVHGNELNGVPCIHRVITDIDVSKLRGTVVAVPCINVPGYLRFTREFSDGKDLNRLFPGQESGTAGQIYAYQIMNKIVSHFNYLIDLHTASFGRINSYYVRSDMNDPTGATMAKLQQPQIILHNSGQDGTLRSAAMNRGIGAITVEIGNPQLFQNQFVQWSYMGVMRILSYFNMFEVDPVDSLSMGPPPSTILCSKGFWIYTKTGGVLEVYPQVNTVIKKGALIARIKNIFGNIVDEIYAPSSGVTIGRSSNPVAMAGDRVLHLGVIRKEGETLAKEAKENY
ncbi:hypothetical protein HK104_010597 [Borealophlyctis nickersoniae]|nr:hypothetical protein HK104_010597 [Borealophlyctis nickersoniae]